MAFKVWKCWWFLMTQSLDTPCSSCFTPHPMVLSLQGTENPPMHLGMCDWEAWRPPLTQGLHMWAEMGKWGSVQRHTLQASLDTQVPFRGSCFPYLCDVFCVENVPTITTVPYLSQKTPVFL